MQKNDSSQNKNVLISIVIPAYNEEKKIEQDLQMVNSFFQEQTSPYELIVVNDGSKDHTLEKIEKVRSGMPSLKILSDPINRGKGYAVRQGILASQGDYVLFADAGGCVPYNELKKGLKLLQDGYDVAMGSRVLADSKILAKQKFYRQIGGKCFWYIVRYFLGIKGIKDTQCGFKIFKREAAAKIFALQRVNGFMFDVEWVLNAQKLGYRIREFPVLWKSDMDSRFHPFPGAFKIIWDVIRIKLRSLVAQ
ncbi:MAG: glycosyltransferase family 2 protein [Elusimicrobia bacterium]|nr:glycosyltransferase family 2 protein [Elusimicrobiota bacterium]